jgi:hypothetical protein
VFFAFDYYRAEKDWTVAFIDFNKRPSSVLPPDILAGGR